jgi:hypothetical protein
VAEQEVQLMKTRNIWTAAARALGVALVIGSMSATASWAEDPAAGTSYAPDFAQWCQDTSLPADHCANPTAEDKARYAQYLDKREELVAGRDTSRRRDYDFQKTFAKHDEPYRPPEN